MKYIIECSLGEIIDKLTILEIKLDHAKTEAQKENIEYEYNSLIKYKKNDRTLLILYDDLLAINKKLWNLENKIRFKSSQKQFNSEYIEISEDIHHTNDKRYAKKREINNYFGSRIKEEKIYNLEKCDDVVINVINLDYRQEKWETITNEFTFPNFPLKRYNAIKGSDMNIKNSILKPGEIGCFTSHRNLWQECVDNNQPFIIIAEDDIIKPDDFNISNISSAINELSDIDWDILYMSQTIDTTHTKENIGFKYNLPSLTDKYNLSESNYKYFTNVEPRCGLHFYIMSLAGCKKCIETCQDYKAPIDVLLWYSNPPLKSFILKTGLVGERNDVCDTFSNSLLYETIQYIRNELPKKLIPKKFNLTIPKEDEKIVNNLLKSKNIGQISKSVMENIINTNSEWYKPYYILANYYKDNNQTECLKYTKKTLEYFNSTDKKDIDILVNCGKFLHCTLLDTSIVLNHWLYCIHFDKTRPEPYVNIIELLLADKFVFTQNLNEINQLLEAGLSYNLNDYIFIGTLARFYEYQEEHEKAINYYFRALKIAPNNPQLLHNTGLIIAKSQNRPDDCEKYFKKALAANDNLPYIYKSLIKYYNKDRVNRYEDTEIYALKAFNKFKTNDFLLELGKVYLNLPDFKKAEKYLLELLNKNDKDNDILAECYIYLSKLYKYKKDFEKSEEYILKVINNLNIYYKDYNTTRHPKHLYGHYLLLQKKYQKGWPYYMFGHMYYNLNNSCVKKLIPEKSGFFKPNDTNKTMILFNSGGFGDLIMYSRFINRVCSLYSDNKIVFLVDTKLLWLLKLSNFFSQRNITLIAEKNLPRLATKFDYQSDVFMLSYFLGLEYEDIYFKPYLVNVYDNYFYNKISHNIERKNKKIVINWHGNRENGLEKWKRGIDLSKLKPLFSLPNISWISVQKELEPNEKLFLKENNILDLSEQIDKGDKAFVDTTSIFLNSDLVISTDTSLLHLAATLKVETWGLITHIPEWRWGLNDNKTNWYPNMKIFRQSEILNWDNVVSELLIELTK